MPRLRSWSLRRGIGVARGRGEGRDLGDALGLGVAVTVGVAVGVALGLTVGVVVGLAVGVGVGVGVGALPTIIWTTPSLNGLAQRLPFESKSTATTCQCVSGELLGV